MKEIDDTEIEILVNHRTALQVIAANAADLVELDRRVEEHEQEIQELRARLWQAIANLEARKPPQDTNPDPEWYA